MYSRHSGARRRREPGIQKHTHSSALDSGFGTARRPGMTTAAILVALAIIPAAAAAQGVIAERNISAQLARAIVDAAMECSKDGKGLSIAVVDRAGQLKALIRGDGTPPMGAELSRRKAYTARTFRRPSLEWAKRTEGDLAGQRMLTDVIPLGGGVPIKIGDDVIGGVGVSGTSGGQQADEDCAKGAIARVADQLK
jgi:uncharacterized protein GlcG (DUF336 family)